MIFLKIIPRKSFSFSVAAFLLCVASLPVQAVNLIQDYYLPMPEAQLLQGIVTATPAITDTNFTIITSILTTSDGTVIYFDEWEDGYETNLANPTQPTTKIWGDGNDAHGIPPGFAHNPLGIPAGTVIILSNTVPCKPRNPSLVITGDGGDHIAANKALVVTRAGWPSPTGPIDAGAAVILSTLDFGTNFVSPIGQDMPENLFKFVGFYVMVSQDNTTVTIDLDGAGPTPPFTVTLNRGQSYFVNGGVKKGATITTSAPAEANLVCGDTVNSYAYDWFTLYPQNEWSSSYYTPVPSVVNGATLYTTINYFYNINAHPITILYSNLTSAGSFSVPAFGGVEYPMPTNSGASFSSAAGEVFTVLTTVAADPTNNPASNLDVNYNWGYTPLPKGSLTTKAVVGWAPGSSDYSGNGSPVWVTALQNTTLYVRYRGTNTPLTDASGNKYSTNFVVSALQSKKIYVPGTNDQTGLTVYTLDGTLLSVAWGEDPAVAGTGNPYLDLGTSVLPFPVPLITKSAVIVTDTPPAGLSTNDTILYTVQCDNKGLLPLGNTIVLDAPSANLQYISNSTTLDGFSIPDTTNGFPLSAPGYTIPIILSQGTSYFQYLAKVVGATGSGVSNVVNIGGTPIIATNALPPGYGAPSNSVTVYKTLVSPASGSAVVGQAVQFNLQIIDTGNTILQNLSLVDNFPTNTLSYTSASIPVNQTNAGVLTWTNLGSFLPGQSTNISVFFLATRTNALATNIATAASVGATTNNGSTTFVVAGAPTPGIAVSKSILSPVSGQVGVGANVQYNLQVVNSGTTTLTNVSLVDKYPSTNFTFASASVTPNSNTGGQLTWTNIGTFAPGQFTNLTVSFNVTNYTATLSNALTAASVGGITNTGGVFISMTPGALTITKTILSPTNTSSISIGSNVVFRIVIQNTGLIPIGTLPLQDTYPSSVLQFNSAAIPPSSSGGGTLFWTNLTAAGPLAVNAIITNNVTMTVIGGPALVANVAVANNALDTNGVAVAPATGSTNLTAIAGQITGTVYNDINHSGVYTNGDTPLQSVTLSLYASSNGVPSTLLQTFTTTGSGAYQLANLSTGAYIVVETLLPGYIGSAPPNNRAFVNLTSLTTTNVDFFQYEISPTNYAAIGGNVWYDINGSGVYNTNDTPIANIEVDLVQDVNSNGVADVGEPLVQSTFTGTNGAYSFGGVIPGFYAIRELPLTGYYSSAPTNSQIGVYVGSSARSLTNNFFNRLLPTAVSDTNSTLVNIPTIISPLTNDLNPNSDALTVLPGSLTPTNGTASILNGTNVLFTPTLNFTGIATIGYTASDSHGGVSSAIITIFVTPVADLVIGKTAPLVVLATSNFIYSIAVTNLGPSAASSVVVTDTLPAGVTFISASGGGATNATAVYWLLSNLAAGQTTNLTFTAKAPAGGSIITNFAVVSSGTLDTNFVNNTNPPVISTIVPLAQSADLAAGKFGPTNIYTGTNFNYTISITNAGPATATNVVVSDILPAGVSFASASGNGTNNAGVVTWNLGNLANARSSNVTVTVTAVASGTLTNLATVTSSTADPNLTNNVTLPVVTTVTALADVIVANVGPTNVVAGATYTNVIWVTNAGPSVATNVIVTDVLPSGGGVTNLNVGSLTNGQVTNLVIIAVAPGSGPLTNVASAVGGTYDPNLGNNTNGVVISVTPPADLVVVQFGPTNGVAGSNLVFTVTITNLGPSTATNILVTNLLSPRFTFAGSPYGMNSGGTVTWLISSLPVNGVTNFTVTVFATEGGTFTNIASGASAILDSNPTNNNGSLPNARAVTVITALADVAVFKSGSTNVYAGGVASYTITVSNAGPSTATSVVAQDTLPAGATFQSANGSYTNNNGVVTWSGITLAPGTATTFNISLVASASVSSLLNIASATSSTLDPNPTNNNGSLPVSRVTTTVTPVADVQVFLYGPTNVTLGEAFTYTVLVSNAGPSGAVSTLTKDFLPTNLVFTSASGGGVLSNGVVVWPVLPVLANGAVTNFTVNVTQAASGSTNQLSFPTNHFNFIVTNTSFFVGSLTNVASAFATTFDPNTNNNNGTLPTAQVRTVITPGVFSIFLATNTYPTNAVITNTITPIGPNLFVVGTSAFNPQTQLYEEFVSVTNIGTTVVHALRLYVGGLRSGITLYNATGTNNGVPYVEYDPPYNSPLLPFPAYTNGCSVTFVLEFFVADRRPFTNSLTAVAITAPTVAPPIGASVNITQYGFYNDLRNPNNRRYLLQFTSLPGRTYTIEYGPDLLSITNVAVPSIVASATTTFWYDDGPPVTISKPVQGVTTRFYRVILNP